MIHTISTFQIVTSNLDKNQITWETTPGPGKRTAKEMSRLKSMVMLISHGLTKNSKITQAQALKKAWDLAKANEHNAFILIATKKDGSKMKRVVFENWFAYNEVKGTGRPLKEGLKLFVDVAKMECGINSTITATKGLYNLI